MRLSGAASERPTAAAPLLRCLALARFQCEQHEQQGTASVSAWCGRACPRARLCLPNFPPCFCPPDVPHLATGLQGFESMSKARRRAALAAATRRKFEFGAAFVILLVYFAAHYWAHSGNDSSSAVQQQPYTPSGAAATLSQLPQPSGMAQPQLDGQPSTLSFLVCNGFANQRIAILSGARAQGMHGLAALLHSAADPCRSLLVQVWCWLPS